MLSSPVAAEILEETAFLVKERIHMHCQVVFCLAIYEAEHLQKMVDKLRPFSLR